MLTLTVDWLRLWIFPQPNLPACSNLLRGETKSLPVVLLKRVKLGNLGERVLVTS